MEITCTVGNAVTMVGVFGQYLSQKITKKYALLINYKRSFLFSPIKRCITLSIYVCNGGYSNLETSILELTSYLLHAIPKTKQHISVSLIDQMDQLARLS